MNRIVQNFPALSVYEEEHKKGDLIWFLHGLGDTRHTWDEIFNDLKSDFCLLSMDLPGHGSSLEYFNEQFEYMDDAVGCFKEITAGLDSCARCRVHYGYRRRCAVQTNDHTAAKQLVARAHT